MPFALRSLDAPDVRRSAYCLVAMRFLAYLGVQTSYFIGIMGTLAYQMGASTVAPVGVYTKLQERYVALEVCTNLLNWSMP